MRNTIAFAVIMIILLIIAMALTASVDFTVIERVALMSLQVTGIIALTVYLVNIQRGRRG